MSEEQKVILKVNGVDYSGWTSVSITTALESMYRSFVVESSRKVDSNGVLSFGITVGDSVEVFIGKDKVITGYVTKVEMSYGAESIGIHVEGAGRPWVMCSSALPSSAPKTYEKMKITDSLQVICGYFGVPFISQINLEDRETISFSADEDIFGKLKKLLQRKTILLSEDENGNLVLTKAGFSGVANDIIKSGVNVLDGKKEDNAEKIYSEYLVYGQGTNPASTRPVTDNQLIGRAKGSFTLPRVLAKKQTGNAIQTDLDARASLLKDYTEATSTKLMYKVHGWRQSNGYLWRVNQIVKVDDSIFGVKREVLISSVSYSLSSAGAVSVLQLVPAEAFNYVDLTSSNEKAKESARSNLTAVGNIDEASWTRT